MDNLDKNVNLEDIVAPIKKIENKAKLVPEFVRTRGLVKQHIKSFNHFINVDMKDILKRNEIISDVDSSFSIKFLDIIVGEPTIYDKAFQEERPITPHICRLRNLTYNSPITISVECCQNGTKTVRNVIIGRMPIMLRSSKCRLHGKTPFELTEMNECPLDPGGYFIVDGTEKVILMQEQLSKNLIIVEKNKKGAISCQVTSWTKEIASRTVVTTKNGKLYLQHNCFSEDIPIFVVFKAMGIESDQYITQMIGIDDDIQRSLFPCIEECRELEIFSQNKALQYMGNKLIMRRIYGSDRKNEMMDVLATAIFAHVPVKEFNFKLKAMYLACIIKRIIMAKSNPQLLYDSKYYGNKRLELAGSLLALLFEDVFKRFTIEWKWAIDKAFKKAKTGSFDAFNFLKVDTVTHALFNALSTGNWNIKRFRMQRTGVTQVLSRLSYICALGMMTRVQSKVEKTSTVPGSHSLPFSECGKLCPCDISESECNLVNKHLALMTTITTDLDEESGARLAHNLGVQKVQMLCGLELHEPQVYLVFVNGNLIGIKRGYKSLVNNFRKLRRHGILNEFISIAPHHTHRCIYIATDGGRPCRPYIIVENGKPKVTEKHIQELEYRTRVFRDFLKDGLIEYLDVNEENDSCIAMYEKDIKPNTTHLEIEPYTLLGVCAGLIPYINHNAALHNIYQCSIAKQAAGTTAWNQKNRMDPLMHNLIYPQQPIVKTQTLDLINFDKLPAGQNAVVAVMSYSGYDLKNAIVLNKASLDRGFGRSLVYKTKKAVLKQHKDQQCDQLLSPTIDDTGNPIEKHSVLDSDGIAATGAKVLPPQVLINKRIPIDDELLAFKTVNSGIVEHKGNLPACVERVMITSNAEESTVIKVLLREKRIPEVGDKFSDRHGQKGVVGLIVEQEDLPFSNEGIIPDLIINPHGFASRMTVGEMFELLAGKAGALTGTFKYGTAFSGDKIQDISEDLIKCGFNYQGKDCMTSGITGEPLQAYIFFGPIYYQILKHMVVDKIHARARGPRTALTRQPTDGRARDGGLRLGEMERDCLIGHGTSMVLLERLMLSSDAFDVDVCGNCGLMGTVICSNWCHFCKSSSNIASIKMPYACKLLFQELQSMNIVPRLKLN